MSKTFEFDPDLWFRNKALRGCSPAARGLWIDLLALMHSSGGYLTINDKPIDDAKLSRLIGEPIKSIRAWIKELGEAGVFSVDGDSMCSSRMIKKARFAAAAKKHGQAGQKIRKTKTIALSDVVSVASAVNPDEAGTHLMQAQLREHGDGQLTVRRPVEHVKTKPALAKKPLAWWKSPAGWVRKGNEQGVSMAAGEELDDFKFRVASRISPGAHLDELSERRRKEILAKIAKDEDDARQRLQSMRAAFGMMF